MYGALAESESYRTTKQTAVGRRVASSATGIMSRCSALCERLRGMLLPAWMNRRTGRRAERVMESNNSGYASRSPQSAFSTSLRRRDVQAPPAPGPRRAFRRLHAQQQYMPLLIVTIALMLLVVIATGYVAARANATSNAEATARANALLAREVVSERGQFPAIANNQLVASNGASNYSLVNDTWVVDHVRQLTGDQAVIYQLIATSASPSSLQAVSSNMHRTDAQGNPIANTRATGESMPANAQLAIFGACGQVTVNTACYGDFSGEVTIAGVS